MPRKQKVIEQPPLPEVEVLEQTIDDTTIQATVPPEAPLPTVAEDNSTLLPDTVKEIKVKPKRKPQQKKIQVKEIEEVKEQEPPNNILLETTETIEQEKPKNKVKTLEQVKCETCEKDMTKRTLRYHHKCPGQVVKREEIPVKKRIKKESKKEEEQTDVNISTVKSRNDQQSNPEKPRLTNTYQDRLQKALEKRAENMQKLASQIA